MVHSSLIITINTRSQRVEAEVVREGFLEDVGFHKVFGDKEVCGELKRKGNIKSRRQCWEGKPMVKIGLCVTLVYV